MSKLIINKVAALNAVCMVAVLMLSGCSLFGGNKNTDFRAGGGKIQPLEVPPDLTSPSVDDRFVIPDGKATTYSQYSQRGTTAGTTGSGIVQVGSLKIDNARVERAGEQRWLVVNATPEKVWPALKEFWADAGYTLRRENAAIGIMETDWREDRTRISQDLLRNTVGRILDGLWSSNTRDKYRVRIEPGLEAGTTDIYLSHRGLEEVYTNTDKTSTGWQPRAADRDLEAETLNRMMAKFGVDAAKATALASAAVSGNVAASTSTPKATYDNAKGGPLQVSEPFDRTWRRVGLALDRSGFTVEDRDRSKGLFFVRYIDPEGDSKSSDKGFLDKLAFWRSDDPASKPQYRIYVAETGGTTNVEVQTGEGKPDNSATAKRILALLLDQLK
jgi:outer membrane protein assembly factor BamC